MKKRLKRLKKELKIKKYKLKDLDSYLGNFIDGIEVLGQFLFEGKECPSIWADANRKIWGNDYGIHMFTGKIAFGKRGNEILTLKDIGERYKAVAKRLRARK